MESKPPLAPNATTAAATSSHVLSTLDPPHRSNGVYSDANHSDDSVFGGSSANRSATAFPPEESGGGDGHNFYNANENAYNDYTSGAAAEPPSATIVGRVGGLGGVSPSLRATATNATAVYEPTSYENRNETNNSNDTNNNSNVQQQQQVPHSEINNNYASYASRVAQTPVASTDDEYAAHQHQQQQQQMVLVPHNYDYNSHNNTNYNDANIIYSRLEEIDLYPDLMQEEEMKIRNRKRQLILLDFSLRLAPLRRIVIFYGLIILFLIISFAFLLPAVAITLVNYEINFLHTQPAQTLSTSELSTYTVANLLTLKEGVTVTLYANTSASDARSLEMDQYFYYAPCTVFKQHGCQILFPTTRATLSANEALITDYANYSEGGEDDVTPWAQTAAWAAKSNAVFKMISAAAPFKASACEYYRPTSGEAPSGSALTSPYESQVVVVNTTVNDAYRRSFGLQFYGFCTIDTDLTAMVKLTTVSIAADLLSRLVVVVANPSTGSGSSSDAENETVSVNKTLLTDNADWMQIAYNTSFSDCASAAEKRCFSATAASANGVDMFLYEDSPHAGGNYTLHYCGNGTPSSSSSSGSSQTILFCRASFYESQRTQFASSAYLIGNVYALARAYMFFIRPKYINSSVRTSVFEAYIDYTNNTQIETLYLRLLNNLIDSSTSIVCIYYWVGLILIVLSIVLYFYVVMILLPTQRMRLRDYATRLEIDATFAAEELEKDEDVEERAELSRLHSRWRRRRERQQQRQTSASMYVSANQTPMPSVPGSYLRPRPAEAPRSASPSEPLTQQQQQQQQEEEQRHIPLRAPPFNLVSVFNNDYQRHSATNRNQSLDGSHTSAGPSEVEMMPRTTLTPGAPPPPPPPRAVAERQNEAAEGVGDEDPYGTAAYLPARSTTDINSSHNSISNNNANANAGSAADRASVNNSSTERQRQLQLQQQQQQQRSEGRGNEGSATAATSATLRDVVVDQEEEDSARDNGNGSHNRNPNRNLNADSESSYLSKLKRKMQTQNRNSSTNDNGSASGKTNAMESVVKKENGSNSSDDANESGLENDITQMYGSSRDRRLVKKRKGLPRAVKRRLRKFKSKLLPERRTHSEEDEAGVAEMMGLSESSSRKQQKKEARERRALEKGKEKERKRREKEEEDMDPRIKIRHRYTKFDDVNSDNEEEVVLFELHQQIIKSITADDADELSRNNRNNNNNNDHDNANNDNGNENGNASNQTTTEGGGGGATAEAGGAEEQGAQRDLAKLSASGIAFITRILYTGYRRRQIRNFHRFTWVQFLFGIVALVFVGISYGGRLSGFSDYLTVHYDDTVSSTLFEQMGLTPIRGDALGDDDRQAVFRISAADLDAIIAQRSTLIKNLEKAEGIPGTLHRFAPPLFIGVGAVNIAFMFMAMVLRYVAGYLRVW